MSDVMTGTPFIDHISIKKPKGKRRKNKNQPAETISYCVHEWCYVAFLWRCKGCPPALLYRLVKSLTFQSSPWQNDYRDRQARTFWGLYPGADVPTPASIQGVAQCAEEMQPLLLGQLPAEIRAVIWRHAHGSAYMSFLVVVTETALLAKKMRRAESKILSLPNECVLLGQNLSVFDTSYISNLDISLSGAVDQDDAPLTDDPGPLVRNYGVTSLQFVATQGGICRLRAVGKDFTGEWIGESPGTKKSMPMWYGQVNNAQGRFKCTFSVRGANVSHPCTDPIQDLNLVEVSGEVDDVTLETTKAKKQIVWDRSDCPTLDVLPQPSLSLFDYDPQRELDDAIPERQPFSHVRMFKYLPFVKGRDYMTGMTVYCGTAGGDDGLRMTGIEAHFASSSQLSGSCDGMAMYFHFAPGEKIAYVWLRSCGDPWTGYLRPSLAVCRPSNRLMSLTPGVDSNNVWSSTSLWSVPVARLDRGGQSGSVLVDPSRIKRLHQRPLLRTAHSQPVLSLDWHH